MRYLLYNTRASFVRTPILHVFVTVDSDLLQNVWLLLQEVAEEAERSESASSLPALRYRAIATRSWMLAQMLDPASSSCLDDAAFNESFKEELEAPLILIERVLPLLSAGGRLLEEMLREVETATRSLFDRLIVLPKAADRAR